MTQISIMVQTKFHHIYVLMCEDMLDKPLEILLKMSV